MTEARWQTELARSFRSSQELCHALNIDHGACVIEDEKDFPILVPRPFAAQMTPGDPKDPLLRQVLSVANPFSPISQFTEIDPLEEQRYIVAHGIVKKYKWRALLHVIDGCAVNCRYCFRRHHVLPSLGVDRRRAFATLRDQHPDVREVILSGGDPWLLNDQALARLLKDIQEELPDARIRFHTRLPIVLPQRVTSDLLRMMSELKRCVVVVHVNHAREISPEVSEALHAMSRVATVLSQSVMLRGVNNDPEVLADLSVALFDAGVMPYYLHVLDPVAGAEDYAVAETSAREIHEELKGRLAGYLVPKLVKEQSGCVSKTWLGTA